MRAPVLAKLSRPRVAGAVARERLFARIDECRQGAAVWIAGPPGAGKTTLAASYAEGRGIAPLWYQVDAGDGDPASLFYYLRLAARQAGLPRKINLPLLTPEYMGDLEGFTRRWFRLLFQGLPGDSMLVFDNLQEAPVASGVMALLNVALGQRPADRHVLLISREDPPANLARWSATQALAVLGWQDLQLTIDEARQIAAHALPTRTEERQALAQRCGGWAAGLTILLDHARSNGRLDDIPATRQAMFGYFAAELFDRLAGDVQHLLLSTSLLNWVDIATARQLSGIDHAGRLLEDLRRRQLFTQRRAGADGSYHYHALFREFLVERMQRSCSGAEQRELKCRSARLLVGRDDDTALQLFIAAPDFEQATGLILQQAAPWAAQGRWQTLARWITALPAGIVQRQPWLGYWLAISSMGADPLRTRSQLEVVFSDFDARADLLGQSVTAAGILETHNIEFGDFRSADRWIDALQHVLARSPCFPSPDLELNVLSALLGTLLMRLSHGERIAAVAARVAELVDLASETNSRVAGATRLLQYHAFFGEPRCGETLLASMRHLLQDAALSPLNRCTWLHMQALYFQFCVFDGAEARQAIDQAVQLVLDNNFSFCASIFHSTAALVSFNECRLDRGAEQLTQATPARHGKGFDIGWHAGMRAWLDILEGRADLANERSGQLLAALDATGAEASRGMALLWHANALLAAGCPQEALEQLRLARERHVGRVAIGAFTAEIIEADILGSLQGQAAALPSLMRGFSLARKQRLFNTQQWLRPQMARLCALALDHDIEPAFVRELIRHRKLSPPSPDARGWPWAVRIACLGGLQIWRDDEPLRFEGKAQRKPLAVLKALIALGGHAVPQDRLIGIVWDDSLQGDEQKAFDVTLHRLRKLLGHDRALLVSDRKLSLNPELVWLDRWALDREFNRWPSILATAFEDSKLTRVVAAVLDLYKGKVLQGEPDADWLWPVRAQMASRLRSFILRAGDEWEAGGHPESAARLYERGIELDPIAEMLYCRLMTRLSEQGRCNEAIELFRRCRRSLSITLGVAPGTALQNIYRQLLSD